MRKMYQTSKQEKKHLNNDLLLLDILVLSKYQHMLTNFKI